jgi:hypothetical protein
VCSKAALETNILKPNALTRRRVGAHETKPTPKEPVLISANFRYLYDMPQRPVSQSELCLTSVLRL